MPFPAPDGDAVTQKRAVVRAMKAFGSVSEALAGAAMEAPKVIQPKKEFDAPAAPQDAEKKDEPPPEEPHSDEPPR